MARVRGQDLRRLRLAAGASARSTARNGVTIALALAASMALFLSLAVSRTGALLGRPLGGDFYAVFPHGLLAWTFGLVFLFACVALAIGATRFCRDISTGRATLAGARRSDAPARSTLRYLGGGHGQGCNDEDDAFTLRRRRFHHLTFYGFLLCFAATCVATLYHYVLGERRSLPAARACRCCSARSAASACSPDRQACSGSTSGATRRTARSRRTRWTAASSPCSSSPAPPAWRCSPGATSGAMALWLAIHLGVVMALFLTLPYGKFAHGVFRSAALLKWAIEKRPPSTLKLSED